jgi:hypothetical protein
MWDVGFDVSFRDCPAKGGMVGHPSLATVWIMNKHGMSVQISYTDNKHHAFGTIMLVQLSHCVMLQSCINHFSYLGLNKMLQ